MIMTRRSCLPSPTVLLSVVMLAFRSSRLLPAEALCSVTLFSSRPTMPRFEHQQSTSLARPLLCATKQLSSLRTMMSSSRANRKVSKGSLYRADRVLANRSGKSRSECFQLLKEKRIWMQTDEDRFDLVQGPSAKLPMSAVLFVDRTQEIPQPSPLLSAYHKPKWVLSVRRDPQNRPCLDESRVPGDLHAVGRLDYDSSGLLLLSSSGALTQRLLHPKHAVEKEYRAVVTGRVDAEDLTKKLAAGVETADGTYAAELRSVEHFDESDVRPYLDDIREKLPSEYNQTDLEARGYLDDLQATELSTVTLTVTEGKHRMLRRMLANSGHPVVTLNRLRFGAVALGDLAPGKRRELTAKEMAWAESLLSTKTAKKKYKKNR